MSPLVVKHWSTNLHPGFFLLDGGGGASPNFQLRRRCHTLPAICAPIRLTSPSLVLPFHGAELAMPNAVLSPREGAGASPHLPPREVINLRLVLADLLCWGFHCGAHVTRVTHVTRASMTDLSGDGFGRG